MPVGDSRIDPQERYRALGKLALSAAAGAEPLALLQECVNEAVRAVGLAAGGVRIYGTSETDLAYARAGDQAAIEQMEQIEQTLIVQLRRTWSVKSLFMTLDLNGPAGLFTYPLRYKDSVLGAITGISLGERSLAAEEEFVSYLAAMITLIGRSGPAWGSGEVAVTPSAEEQEKIRTTAVVETGAALNHEINNPLMAVLGNVQLLLRKSPPLDAETIAKLTKIEEAADRIRDVTQSVIKIKRAQSVPYPGGGRMIDIDNSPKRDEPR
jgi:signal transduction histidine kinase